MHTGNIEKECEKEIETKWTAVCVPKRKNCKCKRNETERTAQLVREHIESFPALEGHYTRKDSNRRYLGHELNITKMYELYLELHKGKLREDELVSQPIYRRIFNEEYNFSFHKPKKINALSVFLTTVLFIIKQHRKRKEQIMRNTKIERSVQERKNKRIKISQSQEMIHLLQHLISKLFSLVSRLFYTRKLSCYNLSIYNLNSSNATCYLWSEVEAKRGSCEIGTCLYLQLLSLPTNIKHAIFYSDACSGQNRNQFTATSLMHAVTYLQNIDIVDHKFLESGHTQMECDMHAAIEFAKKKTEIYIPQQWSTVIRMARRKDPYNVVPLTVEDIWDFKKVQSQSMKYNKIEINGTKINWLNIKWLRFMKEDPDNILFKYNFEEDFRKMKVTGSGKRGRPIEKIKELPRKYTGKQPISQAKKKDLLNLCKTKIISSEYHDFYKNLPSSNNVADNLPEPDVEEDDTDSETD
ncbi:hypothetical protein FSP39_009293 [Pinctada imbricata]|uniref:Uncharacterized protein n=1 Tax=Pinctada imbricata TaxID=66713 RepID=A0AA89C383_PINIB|nr:hypothetical protein FSP39_009293 [Pinctada imbricata]